MTDIAVHVEGLGKRYRLGAAPASRTAYDAIAAAFRAPFRRRIWGQSPRQSNTIWALKDITFDLRRGEVLGIIGRNGAGKSTLLKILSRITEPTEGTVDLYGRVSSLLEVGTGFHPELTGRENIFLNGAILGMRRAEIARKFDRIVDFAEVERFLDTPVKHYSSGMYLRLAFAVAAHLEPEILLVDEVLAVGDAAFQEKCLGKMGNVAREGRTVLLVTHNMGAISCLCREAIWIDQGRMRQRGKAAEVVGRYLSQSSGLQGEIDLGEFTNRNNPGPACIRWVAIKNSQGAVTGHLQMGDKVTIEFAIQSKEPLHRLALSVSLKTSTGIPVLHLVDRDFGFTIDELYGTERIRVTIPQLALYPGSYLVSVWIGDSMGNDYDYVVDCLSIEVTEGTLIRRNGLSWNQAVVACQSAWERVERGA